MMLRAIRWTTLLGAALTSTIVFAAGLPALPEGLSAPAKPTQMPAFSLAKPDGVAVKAESLHDKVVIARFWATW